MNDWLLSLTGRVVDVKEGSERIALRHQAVSNFPRNAFIAILSVNLKNLKREFDSLLKVEITNVRSAGKRNDLFARVLITLSPGMSPEGKRVTGGANVNTGATS